MKECMPIKLQLSSFLCLGDTKGVILKVVIFPVSKKLVGNLRGKTFQLFLLISLDMTILFWKMPF